MTKNSIIKKSQKLMRRYLLGKIKFQNIIVDLFDNKKWAEECFSNLNIWQYHQNKVNLFQKAILLIQKTEKYKQETKKQYKPDCFEKEK